MSSLFSNVGSLFGKSGGGNSPGNTATSSSGGADNHSINVVSGDGSLTNLKQLMQVANGAPANGGFTGVLSPANEYVAPTPSNPSDEKDWTPIVILAVAGIGVLVLLKG